MVNKPDFSDPMQVPGLTPLVQELLSKSPAQAFTVLANMSAADFSLLSKIVSGLLSKKNFEGMSKFNHLVTLLPSLQKLYPEAIKRLEAEGKSELSAHSFKNHFAESSKGPSQEGHSPKQRISESFKDRLPQRLDGAPQEQFQESFKTFSKEHSPQPLNGAFKEQFQELPKERLPQPLKEPYKESARASFKEFSRELRPSELSKGLSQRRESVDKPSSGTQVLEKGRLASFTKEELLQKGKGDSVKSVLQELRLGENPITELGLPAMLATMKEVLSILAYFTNHTSPLKLESLNAFQKVIESSIDQLVQPVATPSEGEFEPQNREIPGQTSPEKAFLKEKSLPLPSDFRQRPEKALHEHRIEKAPNNVDRPDREYKSSSSTVSRPAESHPQELGISKADSFPSSMSNPKIIEGEVKPASISIPAERIAISAAPFSFQHPISTAPRKAKKKSQDPWEEEEERRKDDEDSFSPNS